MCLPDHTHCNLFMCCRSTCRNIVIELLAGQLRGKDHQRRGSLHPLARRARPPSCLPTPPPTSPPTPSPLPFNSRLWRMPRQQSLHRTLNLSAQTRTITRPNYIVVMVSGCGLECIFIGYCFASLVVHQM